MSKTVSRSGVIGVRYAKKDNSARPWLVVYKEKSYGYFPSVEEAEKHLNLVKDAVDNGNTIPENPYKGKRVRSDGSAANTATGISGIQKVSGSSGVWYRVVHKCKRYGQYRSIAEARVRQEEVMYCLQNGLDIPPSPEEKRHREHLEKQKQAQLEKERKQKYREDLQKLREQKRREIQKEANKSKPCKQARYSAVAIETAEQLQNEEKKQAEQHRTYNRNYPKPVSEDERPAFHGKSQKQRDIDACRKCYWSANGVGNVPSCLYGITPGNRSRLAMHYERTGKQDPKTLTYGEHCTEWTPKKKSREVIFNSMESLI